MNTARETSPELVAFRTTTTDDASNRKEKEAEAEAEREMELQLQMVCRHFLLGKIFNPRTYTAR